jgi:hypothetical protein
MYMQSGGKQNRDLIFVKASFPSKRLDDTLSR